MQSLKLGRVIPVVALSAILAFAAGCNPKVSRVDSNEVTDLIVLKVRHLQL